MKTGDTISKATFLDVVMHYWMHQSPFCCLWGIMELAGPLDDKLIEKTVRHLIKSAPIVCGKLYTGWWRGKWKYIDPGNYREIISREVTHTDDEADILLKGIIRNPIDTDNPPLFRVISIDSPNRHFLVLQVHHVIVDGGGAKSLFSLFSEIYRNIEKKPDWKPGFSDMNRSWVQLIRHLEWRRLLKAPICSLKESVHLLCFLIKACKTVNIIPGDNGTVSEGKSFFDPRYVTLYISDAELDNIKKVIRDNNTKLNDLLMSALMTAINQWSGSRSRNLKYVNTFYTADQRRWWGEPGGSLSNMSIIRSIDLKVEDLKDVNKTLHMVKKKIDKAKKEFGLSELWYFAVLMIQPVLISKFVGFILRKMVSRIHALTNIGIIDLGAGDFGKIRANAYSLIAPAFPAHNILFTATGYRNSVTIHCNYDNIHMSDETAKRLMETIRKNILSIS